MRQDGAGLGRRLPARPSPSSRGTPHWVTSAAFSPDGSGSSPPRATRRRGSGTPPPARPIAALQGHTNWVYSAAFSPDGKRVVTASIDNRAQVWDAAPARRSPPPGAHASGRLRRVQPRRQAGRHRLRRQDGAGLGRRRPARPSPRSQGTPTARSFSAAFSPDGNAGRHRIMATRRRGSGTPTPASPSPSSGAHDSEVCSAAFSPDGQRVVTAS